MITNTLFRMVFEAIGHLPRWYAASPLLRGASNHLLAISSRMKRSDLSIHPVWAAGAAIFLVFRKIPRDVGLILGRAEGEVKTVGIVGSSFLP
jgi:hypothetical protein